MFNNRKFLYFFFNLGFTCPKTSSYREKGFASYSKFQSPVGRIHKICYKRVPEANPRST